MMVQGPPCPRPIDRHQRKETTIEQNNGGRPIHQSFRRFKRTNHQRLSYECPSSFRKGSFGLSFRFLCLARIVVTPAGDNSSAVKQQGTRCCCAAEDVIIMLFFCIHRLRNILARTHQTTLAKKVNVLGVSSPGPCVTAW
jgi:hypothetical protein